MHNLPLASSQGALLEALHQNLADLHRQASGPSGRQGDFNGSRWRHVPIGHRAATVIGKDGNIVQKAAYGLPRLAFEPQRHRINTHLRRLNWLGLG